MAKEEVTNVEEQVEAPVEGQEAGVPQSVSLQDLQLLGQIVDLASQRGAFRGNELSQVGAVYDKLTAFLGFVAEQQEANAEEGEGAVDEEASAGEE
jgi:hypothetical protein